MRFRDWCSKHPEMNETGFLNKLKANDRKFTALCNLDYPEQTWDNIMLPANDRFAADEERKKAARERKAKEKQDAKQNART